MWKSIYGYREGMDGNKDDQESQIIRMDIRKCMHLNR
jgi:hypothetical protein